MPAEVAVNPVVLPDLPVACFTEVGAVADVAGVADLAGVAEVAPLLGSLELRHAGVHTAARGVIQDPAGSAIGGGRPSGSGASGAIYAAFPDLEPIPWIEPRAAILNSSRGPGRRVLHTHSPQLAGTPESPVDRRQALEDLANAYANAIEAVRREAVELGDHAGVLNLVPVAASIFAGAFRYPGLDHLHPSYSITAVLIASGWSRSTGDPLPHLTLSFFGSRVFEVATEVVGRLS
jgi:hypothetical protein